VNAPVAPVVPHVDDNANPVADQSPVGPATPDVIATEPPDEPVDVVARSIAGADAPAEDAEFRGTSTVTV
jgi:hypothetical protein